MGIEAEDDDFMAGIDGLPTETPEVKQEPVAEVVEPAPKYAQITEDELIALRASAAQITEIKATQQQALDKAFGTIGGMQRTLNSLQQAGVSQVSLEDFPKLAEFPEIAEGFVDGLNNALAKVKGTQPAAQQVDTAAILAEATARAEQIVEVKALTREHKDWRAVTVTPEFAAWRDKQPDDIKAQLADTWDADFLSEQLTKFKESRKPAPAPAPSKRTDRFAQAVTPRGTGGHATGPSEDDDFLAGVNSRRTG